MCSSDLAKKYKLWLAIFTALALVAMLFAIIAGIKNWPTAVWGMFIVIFAINLIGAIIVKTLIWWHHG